MACCCGDGVVDRIDFTRAALDGACRRVANLQRGTLQTVPGEVWASPLEIARLNDQIRVDGLLTNDV